MSRRGQMKYICVNVHYAVAKQIKRAHGSLVNFLTTLLMKIHPSSTTYLSCLTKTWHFKNKPFYSIVRLRTHVSTFLADIVFVRPQWPAWTLRLRRRTLNKLGHACQVECQATVKAHTGYLQWYVIYGVSRDKYIFLHSRYHRRDIGGPIVTVRIY